MGASRKLGEFLEGGEEGTLYVEVFNTLFYYVCGRQWLIILKQGPTPWQSL